MFKLTKLSLQYGIIIGAFTSVFVIIGTTVGSDATFHLHHYAQLVVLGIISLLIVAALMTVRGIEGGAGAPGLRMVGTLGLGGIICLVGAGCSTVVRNICLVEARRGTMAGRLVKQATVLPSMVWILCGCWILAVAGLWLTDPEFTEPFKKYIRNNKEQAPDLAVAAEQLVDSQSEPLLCKSDHSIQSCSQPMLILLTDIDSSSHDLSRISQKYSVSRASSSPYVSLIP